MLNTILEIACNCLFFEACLLHQSLRDGVFNTYNTPLSPVGAFADETWSYVMRNGNCDQFQQFGWFSRDSYDGCRGRTHLMFSSHLRFINLDFHIFYYVTYQVLRICFCKTTTVHGTGWWQYSNFGVGGRFFTGRTFSSFFLFFSR